MSAFDPSVIQFGETLRRRNELEFIEREENHHMNRFEKRKQALDRAIMEQIDDYRAIYALAEHEDRDPSEEERLDIESHLKAIETLKEERWGVEAQIKTLEHVDDIGREIGMEEVAHLKQNDVDATVDDALRRLSDGLDALLSAFESRVEKVSKRKKAGVS